MEYTKTLKLGNENAQFGLEVTEKTKYSISGKVYEITGWSLQGEPRDAELYLEFLMKWDGCCHVWFGDDEGGVSDGYVHLCGSKAWKLHNLLMEWLFKWAEESIPMDKTVSE